MGNPAFTSALSALWRMYRLMDQSLPIGALNPFKPTKVLDTPAFTAEARFLTPVEGCGAFASDGYHLPDSQDPLHVLRGYIESGKYCYTEDNHVEFSELGGADFETGYDSIYCRRKFELIYNIVAAFSLLQSLIILVTSDLAI
jgi:hypothetical protein